MPPDTTPTPDTEKITVLRIGLTTGQTLMALATEMSEDLDELVIVSESDEVIRVKQSQIAYTRANRVDKPTEAEMEAYSHLLKAEAAKASATGQRQGAYL